jgi:replicative DNA helicase
MVGCQLNRAAAPSEKKNKKGDLKEAGKRPTLENLKEAGDLEEDANTVIALYNPSVGTTPPDGKSWGQYIPLELQTLKVREGEPFKKLKLRFDRFTGLIFNMGVIK